MMEKEIIHNNQIKNDSFPTILCFFSRRPWETGGTVQFLHQARVYYFIRLESGDDGMDLIVVELSVGCVLVSCY